MRIKTIKSAARIAVTAKATSAAGMLSPKFALLFAFAWIVIGSLADDRVGWVRTEIASNAVTATAVPFEAFTLNGIPHILAGPFAENGETCDEISIVASSGTVTRVCWQNGAWCDGEGNIGISASTGDTLVFHPLPSDPFGVYLFGRVPLAERLQTRFEPGLNILSYGYPASAFPTSSLPSSVSVDPVAVDFCRDGLLPWNTPILVTNTESETVFWRRNRPYSAWSLGLPYVDWMSVDAAGNFADLTIRSSGKVDVFRWVSDDGVSDSAVWSHLARLNGDRGTLLWRDSISSIAEGAAFYQVSDAECDTDGDGIPDAAERYVYGTSPYRTDTDYDGIPDAAEVVGGTNPLTFDAFSQFAFCESFEPPTVTPGNINGQNGWTSTIENAAIVQTNLAYDGVGALTMRSAAVSDAPVVTRHSVSGAPAVVWIDLQLRFEWFGTPDIHSSSGVEFGFDNDGHPVMTDGAAVVTNGLIQTMEEEWIRCTARLDYGGRCWDFYVNGIIAGHDLCLPSAATSISEISLIGAGGCVDAVKVTAVRPAGLSSDGDAMPDEWEFGYFGSLDRDGSGDADSDGLTDVEECRAGTDPFSSDSDDDGLPDVWEVAVGLSPTDASDADADPDGDGLDNRLEHELGTNPLAFEPDPRVARTGLRAEFRRTGGSLASLPDFLSLADPFAVSVSSVVNHPTEAWLDGGSAPGDYFAARLTGFVNVPSSGAYAFYVTSDDGVSLRVDESEVMSDPSPHSARTKSASVNLAAGWHPIEILYYENAGSEVLKLEWCGPGMERTVVPTLALRHIPENVSPRLVCSLEKPYCVEGETATVAVVASDIDGSIVRTEVREGDAILFSSDEAVPEIALWSLTPGEHDLSVVIVDDISAATTNRVELEVRKVPTGYEAGLAVSYYDFPSALSQMPDFTGCSPVATGFASRVSYPATGGSWEGAPTNLTERFGAVFEGAAWIQETAEYAFSLTSDDGSKLIVDGRAVLDHGGLHGMTTKTASLCLPRGVHLLRLEYFENTGSAGLTLKWAKASGVQTEMSGFELLRRNGVSDDGDGDGMPDWWEEQYGLDPMDPADAALDPDGDGLTNLEECRNWTDPWKPDTDSDGIPDSWEIANGTCAYRDDSAKDGDGDGLCNLDEYHAGTRPDLADTDGDGCADGVEIRNVHSDPLRPDIEWTPRVVGDVALPTNYIVATGTWRKEADGAVYAAERAGSLTWDLVVPTGGVDALAISISQHEPLSKGSEFDLSLFVDGLFVARQIASAPYGAAHEIYFFLPEISFGLHEFRLVWHNWEVNTFLAVHDLRFVSFDGPDLDENGIPDWKDNRSSQASRLDELPLESLVSPVCVEGCDLWRDVLEIAVAYPETNANYSVVKTIGDGFYVDIPLVENGSAYLSFIDRALTNVYPVVWREFDIASGEYATNALIVRCGDSLRLAGFSDRETRIHVYGADDGGGWNPVTNWMQTVSTPFRFDDAGVYLIEAASEGILIGEDVAYAQVEVRSSRFPKRNPAIMIDRLTEMACPELSSRNLIEHDSELSVSAETNGAGSVGLVLKTSADRDLGIVSRIGDNGAISDAVQVTPVWADNGTYYHIVQTYPDGSQLVEVSLLLGAIPPGLTVKLEIFVSGVMFEDGTRTRQLTAEDFDENGQVTIRFIKARGVTTSVCHRTYLYQDGELLYTNK